MRADLRAASIAALLVCLATVRPGGVRAQGHPRADSSDGPADPSAPALALCAVPAPTADPFLAQVARARDLADADSARVALDALEPVARRRAEASPDSAAAQYALAAVLGARLEHESGGTKTSGAARVGDQAQRVLALDPRHPGASYMLGKLHASVLRLSGFKRFMAKRLIGGGALEGASWQEAQRLLEVAAQGAPCVPEHHFELARVYEQRGDAPAAQRELAYVRELTEGKGGRDGRLRTRAEQLGAQWREESGDT